MSTNSDFTLPFGIDFVVEEDLAKTPGFRTWKASGSSYDITCPFCGAKRKMNINTEKNVARCNKCGGGGGYNSITLHAALTGLSNKESFRDLMNRWGGLESDHKAVLQKKDFSSKPTVIPADIKTRDTVYRTLLSKLTLSEAHRKDLMKRGLSAQEIEDGLYKTVPAIGLHTLAYECIFETAIIEKLMAHKDWGIPGFCDLRDPKRVSLQKRKNGFFIPVIQKDGFISGMQIRYDNLSPKATDYDREHYKKYSWYSSSERETGCSVTGCENIHFAGNWDKVPKEICLTEGVLKADIASALSKKPFLGLVGVNNIRQLYPTLNELYEKGAETVKIYVDMDYREKKEVAAALLNIRKEINRVGTHSYTLLNQNREDLVLQFGANMERGEDIVLSSSKPLPNKVWAMIETVRIPDEMFHLSVNEIRFDTGFMGVLKNEHHVLRILDASDMDEKEYDSMPLERKKEFIKSHCRVGILFQKTGMRYITQNWNPKYKGIDDFYLHIRNKGNIFA